MVLTGFDEQVRSYNVAMRLDEIAERQPDKPALIAPREKKRIYTYHEFHEASDQIARGLSASGIRRGMRVALMATPGFDFFALCFALVRAGAVVVMVDPGIGLRNVTACLAKSAPEVYVGTPLSHLVRLLYGWGKDSVRLCIAIWGRWIPMRRASGRADAR